MKLLIFIRDPEHFLRGEMFMGLECCSDTETFAADRKIIAEIDIDLDDIDRGEVVKIALGNLEEETRRVLIEQETRLQGIEKRKGELLALPGAVK